MRVRRNVQTTARVPQVDTYMQGLKYIFRIDYTYTTHSHLLSKIPAHPHSEHSVPQKTRVSGGYDEFYDRRNLLMTKLGFESR